MRGRGVALGIAVVVLVGGAAACGGGDGSARTRPRDPVETTDPGSAVYEGLTKKAAIARAEAEGSPWRITREDEEFFMATQDYDPTRINFEIDDGTVTRATYG